MNLRGLSVPNLLTGCGKTSLRCHEREYIFSGNSERGAKRPKNL